MAESLDFRILERLAPIPTASFYEGNVHDQLDEIYKEEFLAINHMSTMTDRFGNVVWHYIGDPNRISPKSIANVVHTDHPAFHVAVLRNGKLWAKMMGGLNPELVQWGTEVDLHTLEDSFIEKGRLVGGVDEAEGNLSQRYVLVSAICKHPEISPAYATLRFPDGENKLIRTSDGLLHSPIMDDFSAIAMSLAAMKEIASRRIPVDVYTVFHRAEEVGLLGAHAIAQFKGIPPNSLVYSIENSSYKKKTPEGKLEQLAEMGGGIIIRTGDKTIPAYDPVALELLRQASTSMERGKTQERLMTGGTCEAGIYGAQGYRAAGIAVPLKHYHNNGALEGKANFVPEEINEADFHAGTELMVAAAETLARRPELYGTLNPVEPREELVQLLGRVDKRFKAYQAEGLWEAIFKMGSRTFA